MTKHDIVSREEWLEARKAILQREKDFTRLRDELSAERRKLPWVRIDKEYRFATSDGEQSLSDLFDGRSQLIVQHFMFGPDWEEGCPSCSFWADGFDGQIIHMAHRDVTMIAVSNAPQEKLEAYKKRMGWSFKWVTAINGDFSRDFGVTFTQADLASGNAVYNYAPTSFQGTELPGISVFVKDGNGDIFHTYSCYSRGLDMMNAAYHYLDLTPKGRDEDGLDHSMAWLRRKDRYDD